MKFRKLVRAACSIAIFSLSAQTASAGNCDAILKHGITNITVSKSAKASIATKYFNHCHKTFSTLQDDVLANISVEVLGYGGGDANFKRGKASSDLRQWCETNKEHAESSEDLYEESKTIYGGAVAAWQKCEQLSNIGLQVEVEITPNNQLVAIGMRDTSRGSIKYMGYDVRGFECKEAILGGEIASPANPVEMKTNAINLTCIRNDPNIVTRNNGEYTEQDWGSVNMLTTAGPVQVYFEKLVEPTPPTQIVSQLNSEIAQLKDRIEALRLETISKDDYLSSKIDDMQVSVIHDKRYNTKSEHRIPVKPEDGVCAIGGIQGRMAGSGENAYLKIRNGFWLLDLHTPSNPNTRVSIQVICFAI